MHNLTELHPSLERWREPVEQALRDQVALADTGGLRLYSMMRYQLGWISGDGSDEPGPPPVRLYGALCMEGALSTGSPAEEGAVALVAAAVELMTESMTVHEDMQVGEANAEERAAVWWLWGPAQAINVGDALHALGRMAALRSHERGLTPERTLAAVRALDAMALRYYEGQYLELTYQDRVDITERQYLTMTEAKRGAPMGAAALGAEAVGAPAETVGQLRALGECLGTAMQIRDDMAAIWGERDERPGRARLLNKSKLFPVVHALEHGELARKRQLGALYFKRVMEVRDLDSLRQILDDMGARSYSEQQAQSRAAEALAMLDRSEIPPESKERWAGIAKALLNAGQDKA